MELSPFSDDAGTVRLRLTAGSPLAELFLIDHTFALVERAVGELDAAVEQGVYKVKAQLGAAIAEQLIVLNSDQDVDLSDQLAIASPVPLEGTAATHEFHTYAARDESRSVTSSVGAGAQIFLCARRWSSAKPLRAADSTTAPPRLSLHRRDGETIVDVLESGHGDRGRQDAMLAATVEVDPGTYVVRWSDELGSTAEQSVEALRDWQTQVFLLEDARDPADLRHGISLLMARDGFQPDDDTVRVTDEARAALADERNVASELINKSLFANCDNPMLGLFGAHLMLLGRDAAREAEDEERRRESDVKRLRAPVAFDQALYDGAVANLVGLLGTNQPDVTALATQASDRPLDGLEPVTVPPMLWRSWLLLIQASNLRPDVLPADTWRSVLTLRPLRPFLVWSPVGDATETVERWQQGASALVHASMAPSPGPRGGVAADLAPGAERDEVRRRLTAQLLAPRAAIDELVAQEPHDGPD